MTEVEKLLKELAEVAVDAAHVGGVGALLQRAIECIQRQRDDLNALQQMGSDHA